MNGLILMGTSIFAVWEIIPQLSHIEAVIHAQDNIVAKKIIQPKSDG